MRYQQDWLRQILAELYSNENPAFAAGSRRFFTTKMRVLGLSAPELQDMVKKQQERLAGVPASDLIALSKVLVSSQVFEARQLAYLMLHSRIHALETITVADVEELGNGMDNWASVDTFSTQLAGVLWMRGKIPDGAIQHWCESQDLWWRRAALVATVPLNLKSRGRQGDLERTLDICDRLKGDPERMVQKAVSWALRQLSKRFPGEVQSFLGENKSCLAKSTVNEVERNLGNK